MSPIEVVLYGLGWGLAVLAVAIPLGLAVYWVRAMFLLAGDKAWARRIQQKAAER